MDDLIKVGLDFGTHQTKICVQRTPDEGHGEPIYEFFQFEDLEGNSNYFLPSVIQINNDDTLSYGFVNPEKEKHEMAYPQKREVVFHDFNPEDEAKLVFSKYQCKRDTLTDLPSLVKMFHLKRNKEQKRYLEEVKKAEDEYKTAVEAYKNSRCLYRYFKQATFAERPWEKNIDSITLSVWYLSYIIFRLEEKYGTNFKINMGIPADDEMYERKRMLAISVLATAYQLVEDIYKNDIEEFLKEKIDDLKSKTKLVPYNPSLKDEYQFNIFPEAYASLVTLTSKGKLTNGMSLTVDIGGGTTDISFFTVGDNDTVPLIYKYWSIQKGLNYIAEASGFDYSDEDFNDNSSKEIIEKYNYKKQEIVGGLVKKLLHKITTETNIPKENLLKSLKERIVVYAGGGSSYRRLTNPISYFTDVHKIGADMWKEERIVDKDKVQNLCFLLTTAYGLSLAKDESDVKLCPLECIFDGFAGKTEVSRGYFIDKDAV